MHHIAVFGCPRSGTSWLGQIFNSEPGVQYRYQPLFSHEFKDWFGRYGSEPAHIAAFADALMQARSDFVLQDLRPAKSAPTHLVWKEVRYHRLLPALLVPGGLDAVVYLFRHPRDVINSWYQAPKEFRLGQDIHHEWRHAPSKNNDPSEFNGFERWKQSMRMALALKADRAGMLLLDYDRLTADPQAVVRTLFERLALPFGDETLAFVQASTSRHDADPYSVFRARGSHFALPLDIVAEIEADTEAAELLAEARTQALTAPQSVSA